MANCNYSTLSHRKLLNHVVTHHIIYETDCNYLTSCRDRAVKHLRTCHNRRGSITQTDASSWKRLREANPNFPISCPPLPLSSLQYRQASKCSEERAASNSLPITVKRIRTTEGGRGVLDRPIVAVERNVDLKRLTARLREDVQAIDRAKSHIVSDMDNIHRTTTGEKETTAVRNYTHFNQAVCTLLIF